MAAYIAVEFHGTGDPFFGGSADDRTLCISGQFERYPIRARVARLPSREAAMTAASVAAQRKGSKLGSWEVTD